MTVILYAIFSIAILIIVALYATIDILKLAGEYADYTEYAGITLIWSLVILAIVLIVIRVC